VAFRLIFLPQIVLKKNNVDIKFSAHSTFLELPSSGMLKIERLESQIILGAIKPKCPKIHYV